MPYVSLAEQMWKAEYERGVAEGRAEGFQKAVELLLTGEYGEPAQPLFPAVVRRIQNEERLRDLIVRVITAGNLKDIRVMLDD